MSIFVKTIVSWFIAFFVASVALFPSVPSDPEIPPQTLGIVAQQLPVVTVARPVMLPDAVDFDIAAASVMAVDVSTDTVLYEKQPSARRPVASLTKLMTALVVGSLSHASSTVIVMPQDVEGLPQPVMGLAAGEEISVDALLHGMLIMSANDAAVVLSRALTGSTEIFVGMMNQMAKQLGMWDTHFKNATGFDEDGQYSTAADLKRLAFEFLRHSNLAAIVQTKDASVASADHSVRHYLKTSNKLLGKNYIYGIKTGFTDQARGNLILLARDKDDNQFITIVLGSEQREADSDALVRWIFNSYSFHKIRTVSRT